MRPALAVPLTMFFLLRCQQLPVMERVHLLQDTYKRRWLAFAHLLPDFTHLSQPTTEIVASVTKVELRSNVNDVAFAQLRYAAGSAGILDFKKARFAGASGVSGCESAACFRAAVCLVHIFCAKNSVRSLPQVREGRKGKPELLLRSFYADYLCDLCVHCGKFPAECWPLIADC